MSGCCSYWLRSSDFVRSEEKSEGWTDELSELLEIAPISQSRASYSALTHGTS